MQSEGYGQSPVFAGLVVSSLDRHTSCLSSVNRGSEVAQLRVGGTVIKKIIQTIVLGGSIAAFAMIPFFFKPGPTLEDWGKSKTIKSAPTKPAKRKPAKKRMQRPPKTATMAPLAELPPLAEPPPLPESRATPSPLVCARHWATLVSFDVPETPKDKQNFLVKVSRLTNPPCANQKGKDFSRQDWEVRKTCAEAEAHLKEESNPWFSRCVENVIAYQTLSSKKVYDSLSSN